MSAEFANPTGDEAGEEALNAVNHGGAAGARRSEFYEVPVQTVS
jgi:hypothetical protein